ncbi:MAG: hypothetical protein ABWY00_01125 [Dongiaceae bacterium]
MAVRAVFGIAKGTGANEIFYPDFMLVTIVGIGAVAYAAKKIHA